MITSRLRSHIALLAFALVASASARAGEGVTLQYKQKEGDRQIYETSSSMQQKQVVGDQTLQTAFTMKEIAVRTFKEPTADGDFTIASENKRLSFTANIPQVGEYTYDSRKSERESGTQLADELNKVFGRLDGAEITFTMTPRGEVRSVSGIQELLADILEENPIGAQFVGGGSNEAYKIGLAERLVYLPGKPVQPGDTWEQSFSAKLPSLGTMTAKRTFKYEGPDKVGDRPTARISVASEMVFDLNLDQGDADVSGTLKTTKGQGTAQFDPEAGRLLSFKSEIALSGELSVKVGEMVVAVQTEQNQTNTTQLLEELPD
ncbi:MAG TPA: DUF6263 family protein [Planctomycetaceae bacterium]|nr:DUF6263 family protein [Planctomycetaceae bacterium]